MPRLSQGTARERRTKQPHAQRIYFCRIEHQKEESREQLEKHADVARQEYQELQKVGNSCVLGNRTLMHACRRCSGIGKTRADFASSMLSS